MNELLLGKQFQPKEEKEFHSDLINPQVIEVKKDVENEIKKVMVVLQNEQGLLN